MNNEELGRARDIKISPYIAMNWEVEADYPSERRIVLKRNKKFSVGWFIVGLIFYMFPGLFYLLYWAITKTETKTILY